MKLCYKESDITICAAAVSDYKPESMSHVKLKKSDANLELILVKNPDILSWCGENKKKQFLVGICSRNP